MKGRILCEDMMVLSSTKRSWELTQSKTEEKATPQSPPFTSFIDLLVGPTMDNTTNTALTLSTELYNLIEGGLTFLSTWNGKCPCRFSTTDPVTAHAYQSS